MELLLCYIYLGLYKSAADPCRHDDDLHCIESWCPVSSVGRCCYAPIQLVEMELLLCYIYLGLSKSDQPILVGMMNLHCIESWCPVSSVGRCCYAPHLACGNGVVVMPPLACGNGVVVMPPLACGNGVVVMPPLACGNGVVVMPHYLWKWSCYTIIILVLGQKIVIFCKLKQISTVCDGISKYTITTTSTTKITAC